MTKPAPMMAARICATSRVRLGPIRRNSNTVIAIATAADVAGADAFAAIADRILFDAKADDAAELPGGNGVAFDWRALQGFGAPFALSGGLTPDTVANAIAMTGAGLVDVSSGVERAPGEKDPDLVKRFIRAVKSAGQQGRAKAS